MKKALTILLSALLGMTACAPAVTPSPVIIYTPTQNITANASTSINTTLPLPQTNKDILRICDNGTFISNAIAVSDGTYVFTILKFAGADYLNSGGLSVVSTEGTFSVSVFTFDPRTGATLLKINNHKFMTAKLIASSNVAAGQQIIIWSWRQDPDGLHLIHGTANISKPPYGSPVRFTVGMPASIWNSGLDERTVVTDTSGSVLGLIGNEEFSTFWFPAPPPASNTYVPEIAVSTDSIGALLSPDLTKQPWANGPVSLDYTDVQLQSTGRAGWGEVPANYDDISAELQAIFKNVGSPLTPEDTKSLLNGGSGQSISVYYAAPVTIYSSNQIVAQARWVNVQYDRFDGKPNNLIYGDSEHTPTGGFLITGNFSDLAQLVR